MPGRSHELKIGIGFNKQTGTGTAAATVAQLQTALSAGNLWNLGLNAFNAPFPQFKQEDDADFYGKGHEWVTQVFPTSIEAPWEWPYFLTSQNFAQVIAFALGKVTESNPATGAYQYVVTPMDPVTDGVNLPATTIVAGIREGTAGEILDMALVGVACDGFTLKLQRGPGLQNSSLVSRWVGCGKHVNNSGIAIPSRTVETRLGAGSATAITINGVNYITNARFVDMEFTFANNIIPGYFPGSGSQSGFDIAGRVRYGKRTASLIWTVELESDSAELTALLAGTTGATTVTLQGDLITGSTYHKAQIFLPQTRHKGFSMTETDGFVTARIETDIEYASSYGPMVLTGITNKTGIGS
jgi:hypothetical protein